MNRFWPWLRDRFWAIPLLCAGSAAVLGLAVSRIDDRLDTSFTLPFLFAGGPEGARAVLSAIITSMISFTGLVFSITIVVLQLTSSQFSPRVIRSFLRDRFNQLALGIFVATFVYALVALRSVRGTAQVDPFVPQLAVTLALGFVLASVVVFNGSRQTRRNGPALLFPAGRHTGSWPNGQESSSASTTRGYCAWPKRTTRPFISSGQSESSSRRAHPCSRCMVKTSSTRSGSAPP